MTYVSKPETEIILWSLTSRREQLEFKRKDCHSGLDESREAIAFPMTTGTNQSQTLS